MITFKDFLTEAKVSKRNLSRAVEIFRRIYERETGEKLYRFGGKDGYVSIKNGIGIAYVTERGKAIRFNYVSGEIQSITIWEKLNFNTSGDFTIDLGGIGLLDAGKKIIRLVRKPKVGKIGLVAELNEAKRVSPDEFVMVVQKYLSDNPTPGQNIASVSKETLNAAAIWADVNKPTIFTTKIGKLRVSGRAETARYDLGKLHEIIGDKEAKKKSDSKEPIFYVKVTKVGKNGKFVSAKDDKDVQSLNKEIDNYFKAPDVKSEMEDPETLFGHLRSLVRLVTKGIRNSLVIYGGPGTGKTYTVTKTLNDEGKVKGKDWFIVKGKVTTSALYQTLYIHRKGGILVFDDTDSLWKDADAVNILKAALDSYSEREISWVTKATVNVSKLSPEEKIELEQSIDDKITSDPSAPVKLPSEFEYHGQIIFISNLPHQKFDSAVLSRSSKIDMTLTREQMFQRMRTLAKNGFIGHKSVVIEDKLSIVDFLEKKYSDGHGIDAVTLRMYISAEDLQRSGLPNWQEMLKYM